MQFDLYNLYTACRRGSLNDVDVAFTTREEAQAVADERNKIWHTTEFVVCPLVVAISDVYIKGVVTGQDEAKRGG